MKLKSLIGLIIILFIANSSYCQLDNNSGQFQKKEKEKVGTSEFELAILGLGFNRVYTHERYSLGWGINSRYLNVIFATNNDLIKSSESIDSYFDWDYLRLKFIFRKKLSNSFHIDISPVVTASFSQLTEDYYLSNGLDFSLYYTISKRIRLSTAIAFKKSLNSKEYYFTYFPIKLIIIRRNKVKGISK